MARFETKNLYATDMDTFGWPSEIVVRQLMETERYAKVSIAAGGSARRLRNIIH